MDPNTLRAIDGSAFWIEIETGVWVTKSRKGSPDWLISEHGDFYHAQFTYGSYMQDGAASSKQELVSMCQAFLAAFVTYENTRTASSERKKQPIFN